MMGSVPLKIGVVPRVFPSAGERREPQKPAPFAALSPLFPLLLNREKNIDSNREYIAPPIYYLVSVALILRELGNIVPASGSRKAEINPKISEKEMLS